MDPSYDFSQAVVITGPTGSGKSQLALDVAMQNDAEIIAMDSMTLYRGMDIGTAKPTATEQAQVPHHLLDVLDPWESGSVAWWLNAAQECYFAILNRGRRVLIVGGTPLYLNALRYGLCAAPGADPALRAELEAEVEAHGPSRLYAELQSVDAATAARLHPHDTRRIVRALEVYRRTGKPISTFQRSWKSATFAGEEQTILPPRLVYLLQWSREDLYQRIEQRVQAMLESGWIEETERLQQCPQPRSPEASAAIGYSLIEEYLAGQLTREELLYWIQTRTRQYAKQQLTWFRRMEFCIPLPMPQTMADVQSIRPWAE